MNKIKIDELTQKYYELIDKIDLNNYTDAQHARLFDIAIKITLKYFNRSMDFEEYEEYEKLVNETENIYNSKMGENNENNRRKNRKLIRNYRKNSIPSL